MTWLATMGTKLKVWALIFAGYAVLAVSFLLMKSQRDRARDAAERYKAQAHRANTIQRERNKNEQQIQRRRAEAQKEVEAGRGDPVFRDPNILFRDKSDD